MCQPKSKGGKRCLRHAKLSQFMTRFAAQVTGAQPEMVNATMSELNREAKQLGETATVPAAEVNEFIDRQALAVDVEPRLNSHDRKILPRQLAAAREETKQGVDGNYMYAWRNLVSRVRSKMRKALAVTSIFGALSLGLAGCAGGVTPTQSTAPVNQPTSSTSAPAQVLNLGDVVGSGIKVTDDRGTYETVKLKADDDSLAYKNSIVSKNAEANFSKQDIKQGQTFLANFVATQTFDSTAVDNNEQGWKTWQQQDAEKYISGNVIKTVLAKPADQDRSAVIFNDFNNSFPDLVRNGQPRILSEDLAFTGIDAGVKDKIGHYLYVTGKASVEYNVDKDYLIKYAQQQDSSLSRDDIIKQYPVLATNKPVILKVDATLNYSISHFGNDWRIVGYDNKFSGKYENLTAAK